MACAELFTQFLLRFSIESKSRSKINKLLKGKQTEKLFTLLSWLRKLF